MGTSRQKLLEELGWETLYNQRWCRRLCQFFSITTSKSPGYLFNVSGYLPRLPEHGSVGYNLTNPRCHEQDVGRTMRLSSFYFHNTICEWNLLEKSVQDSPSLTIFKSKLLRIIRPEKNPVYNIYDILGIKLLTRLRVNFSPLNEHRFRHNFDSAGGNARYLPFLYHKYKLDSHASESMCLLWWMRMREVGHYASEVGFVHWRMKVEQFQDSHGVAIVEIDSGQLSFAMDVFMEEGDKLFGFLQNVRIHAPNAQGGTL